MTHPTPLPRLSPVTHLSQTRLSPRLPLANFQIQAAADHEQIVGGIARKHLGNIDALQAAVLRGDPFGRRCEKGMWA